MVRELQIIRDAIFTTLQESADLRHDDPAEARKMIDHWVRLGRLDPGQWAPEALVVAHTEGGLPSPYAEEFWKRVTERANQSGCRVYQFDVTHFTVGFFQDVHIPADVAGCIDRAAKEAEKFTRHRLEHELNFNNISSPIEQRFYVCWEAERASLRSELDPNDHDLSRHRLYPQFPITSPEGEEYLIDFAVMRFDPLAYRQLVRDWSARQAQDPYSEDNWISHPYPEERSKKCNVNVKVAIECDSYKHHVEGLSPSEFEYQKRRERFLQADGWTVFAFSGREINRNPMKCVAEAQTYLRRKIREASA